MHTLCVADLALCRKIAKLYDNHCTKLASSQFYKVFIYLPCICDEVNMNTFSALNSGCNICDISKMIKNIPDNFSSTCLHSSRMLYTIGWYLVTNVFRQPVNLLVLLDP